MSIINNIEWLDTREARREPPRWICPAETSLGTLTLVQRGERIGEMRLGGERYEGEAVRETPLMRAVMDELAAYFAGKLRRFTVPLAAVGTPFQLAVWRTLAQTVPYGQTVTYGELARRAGSPAGARAVGMANNRNPLPIFIPCHRVIGAGGKLVGYGGGLEKKEFLLRLEAENKTK